ncbi:HD-GYP domain-containing protein [Clostridium brassicae]|uniref:HD domain-containing protein n=1 Tax=Clostridium brassicae TaxID=2999072 RepID=A0ABT4D952_9CLOT|nr:HD-GYP domain-containing protein [Clostridium brassicae]MCY6958826.1 HD domain-containing protein [Clostridium brassicae]
MKVNLDKTILAMSIALDLAEINSIEDTYVIENISKINYSEHEFFHHSKRTAYIAIKIATELNLDKKAMQCVYISSLLHDIGVTSSVSLTKNHTSEKFIKQHCVDGANILNPFPIFNDISDIILYHHENYNGTGAMGLKKDEIPIISQVIRIADLIELSYKEKVPSFKQRDYITEWIKSKENIIFSTQIVNAFLNLSKKDSFWFDIENVAFIDYILLYNAPQLDIYLNLQEFEKIAEIFSRIIDSKSKFTATHSKGIADLAYKISKHIGYSDEKCIKMKIAGLLHDIGKLAIPSKILDKNGPLTMDEFSIIKSHVYYTAIILNKIEDIPEISGWASNHHEKLDGTGYPNRLNAHELSEESRIIAICDIYQALTEDRPYREGLNIDKTISIMDEMSQNNYICKNALKYLKDIVLE